MIRAALMSVTLAGPALAEDYPRLADVFGVQASDVLNLRSEPDAGSEIVGTLPPDATGIEVVSVAGGWGLINIGEGSGYASMHFLRPEGGPAWHALTTPLFCAGTEPFWALDLDPVAGIARFRTPGSDTQGGILATWPATPQATLAALLVPEGLTVLQTAGCGDGMSDRAYGIAIDVFLTGTNGRRLTGCCGLTRPQG